jgi:hypothetical protein
VERNSIFIARGLALYMSFALDKITGINIKFKVRIVSLLTFLIPVYFFTIGDFYGGGFQTPFFRYLDTLFGSFIVLVSNDIANITTGFFKDLIVFSTVLWITGTIFLLIQLVILFIGTAQFERNIRFAGIFIIMAGICYLLSILVHYGPLFHNYSGTALPIGLILLFLLGVWMYSKGTQETG